jgi:hypothetical protein
MTKKHIATSSQNKTMSFDERVQNALHADEIDALYDELAPGQDAGMVTVLNKYQVTPMLYTLVAKQLDSIALNLMNGIEYSPADLIGDGNWTEFDPEWRRELELCIKHFAAHPKATLKDLRNGNFTRA